MEHLDVIVPVAHYEPISVLKKSVDCILDLEKDDMNVRVIYVLDITGKTDDRLKFLEGVPIAVITRTSTRGRRAGAINDALDACKQAPGNAPDYVALFDVDSRPDKNFLIECTHLLRSNKNVIIASGARFITNENENIITKTIAAEYCFFSDVYLMFERFDGFNQFNGMIGVLNIKTMRDYQFNHLNESASCEDLDFTQQAYLAGFTGGFAQNTRVGEQAPSTIKDLFNQRVRWLSGACQGLRTYLPAFITAQISVSKKLAWFLALSLPFVAFLATPVVPLYGARLCGKYGLRSVIVRTFGLVGHVWLITLCGSVALAKQVLGRHIEWGGSKRSEV
ncbi:MAG: glycosyltransferase family 2 protein [Methanosarcinales archaeon]|nr:MAG: glycosyltransferase family 2 protein [Methanosarcinales archaeon]